MQVKEYDDGHITDLVVFSLIITERVHATADKLVEHQIKLALEVIRSGLDGSSFTVFRRRRCRHIDILKNNFLLRKIIFTVWSV